MLNFYHDQTRNLLIYEHQSPQVLDLIPEAKHINGRYLAVPRQLRNLQILRWMGYPVTPIMDGYDYPIKPGWEPLPSQKAMANFAVLHPRSLNLSDMGCVGGETLIDTSEGEVAIERLASIGKPFKVRTVTNKGPRFVEVPAPFAKGRDKLYRVQFQSGREIVVTKRHVFLTCRGWVSCENVLIGECLPVFDVYPPESTWASSLSEFQLDALRWIGKALDFPDCFDSLSCGAQPRSGEGSVLVSLPSQADVLERSREPWQTDVPDNAQANTDPLLIGRHSRNRCGARIDRGEMGYFLSGYATTLSDSRFHICALYRLSPSQPREASEDQELQLCIPLDEASDTPFDFVTHIAYDREDVYYDMSVPRHHNYVANGFCHHNTRKTLAHLWAADWLMRQNPGMKAVIVAPLSTLERVWGDAIFGNFLARRTFAILHGSADKRIQQLDKVVDFYIINYEGVGVGAHTRRKFELDGFSKRLADRTDIRLAIIDEASAYKDGTTKRHRIARLVLAKKQYLWLLTGTPTPNAPTDAFGLAKLVNNAFGKSYRQFESETMYKVSDFVWKPRADGYEQARKLLTPSIRYDIKDVWDGPELTTQQRQIELTPNQKKMLADLKRDLVVQTSKGKTISAVNEAAARNKLLQISLGAIYDEHHIPHETDAAPRLNELKSVIAEAPGKFLIFAGLTSVVNLLYKNLAKLAKIAIVNGEVSAKDRGRIFSEFQDGDLEGIIADPGSMAHGIDLWMARVVCWYGPTDKPELYQQGNKRAHRPGQKYPVTVVQLVATATEREIYHRLETSSRLQGSLLDVIKRGEL